MSKNRYAARVDANQPQIVKDLRKLPGVTIQDHMDDIVVGYKGSTFWIEIKTGPKAEVKESQKKLLKEWTGHYAICWTTEMILTEIGYCNV